MITVFIEATDAAQFNWGKFMVGVMDAEERERTSALMEDYAKGNPDSSRIASKPLLYQIGFDPGAVWVFDLQTCEGAFFSPSRNPSGAKYDLDKHQIWVCPMFEPFLQWLYGQDLSDITKLPRMVNVGKAATALRGYRRQGKASEL